MKRTIYQILLMAHIACAITGPRVDNDFERRRQLVAALGLPGFSEHETRFGVNSPLQNFQQSEVFSTPAPNLQNFQQPFFPQQQQQSYVPHFSNNLAQSNLQTSLPLPNNGFSFNQQTIQPAALPSAFPHQNLAQIPQQNQNNLPPIPTLPAFSSNVLPLAQNPAVFNNPNIVNIGNQRPTQAAFLPTIPTQHQQSFQHQSAISIHPAPNLTPQNNGQIPFQSTLGHSPILSSPQTSQIQNIFEQESTENLEKIKELQERQRIIQKHQEFVQKQQQKQQEKVEKLHEEFLSKQATKTVPTLPSYTTTESYNDFYNRNIDNRRRPILPHETDLFKKAVELYEKQHPTSTSTTTTTTTTTPASTTKYSPRPTRTKSRNPPQDKNKQQLYNEIKNLLEESETKGFDDNLRIKSVALLQKPEILKQLKVALAENPEDFSQKNFSSREISLNGHKFEVIRTTNPNLIPKGAITADSASLAQIMAQATASPASQKESRLSIEEITKDVLPPGADYELIKQTDNGKLEEVPKLSNTVPNKKKVTFVFLEEQDDGSFKVKGVKANGQQTEDGPEVESILQKIKNGEIQLPGNTKISNGIESSTPAKPTTVDTTDYLAESSHHPSSYANFVSTSNRGSIGHTNPTTHSTPSTNSYRSTTPTRTTKTPTNNTPTRIVSTTERYITQTNVPNFIHTRDTQTVRNVYPSSTVISTTPSHSQTQDDLVVIGSSAPISRYDDSNSNQYSTQSSTPGLVEILKENGLFATAKYLRQSGLDTILNETGPYTFFAPTDKAFRTLLVQLGGPDRAEEKFRDNPRLLSGLLLHHVIPGAFDIASLQDEMTGVSLAGTQLRVNQYDMHDVEWNEVRITTINGARVLEDKKDILIPQGIAHAVDRVMFPLPVGDIVQTLQADRDRRFTTFLKAISTSGFADTLAESKTYTVFAPTDAAFARLSPGELARYTDKSAAKALVARHVLPGTLYSSGMRYYQLRNSMEDAKPLTLQKNSGRIKVNNAQVITHNIPATNGVIHAIDNIL